MTYEVKEVNYWVRIDFGPIKKRLVTGYAVNNGGGPSERFCVRSEGGEWVCDHWETGCWFGHRGDTMDEAIAVGAALMLGVVADGSLERAITALAAVHGADAAKLNA